jgi:hypothetical protein
VEIEPQGVACTSGRLPAVGELANLLPLDLMLVEIQLRLDLPLPLVLAVLVVAEKVRRIRYKTILSL